MSFPAWLSNCASKASAAGSRTVKTAGLGENWAFNIVGYSLGNVLLAPNSKYPNCNSSAASSTSGTGTIQSAGMYGLSSRHPGGANIMMADGSVRFLKDSANMQTVWALGSRAQGEVVSADAY